MGLRVLGDETVKTLYKTVALILATPIVIGVSFFCVALMLMIGVVGLIYGDSTTAELPRPDEQ